ncbi:iron-sulfur cluster assembly scaffold protein [Marisediminicola sp. LYQ85]|uniref:iron-sulfur cluster assembly scaffold protein n=1 Tax=Marisediminicola sp. LYQ85 TaxID=3391062 RepID=UPI00398365D4
MTDPREALIVELDRVRHGAGEVAADTPVLRSPSCGDEVRMAVTLTGGTGGTVDGTIAGVTIADVTWHGRGCTVSMASASALAALAPGRSPAELAALAVAFGDLVRDRDVDPAFDPLDPGDALRYDERLGDAVAFAGIGRLPLRAGCATLAWEALSEALSEALDAALE